MGIIHKNLHITSSEVPILELSPNDPEKVQAIIFDDEGKRYYFSNELGHKVINSSAEHRPMSKKEYKEVYSKMVEKTISNSDDSEQILDEIIKLDFGIGHANSTFQINKPCVGGNRLGSLIINIGCARYIYNADANTVFHIDHSKRITGYFMHDGPEKDGIIHTLTSSKTMAKKIAQATHH